MRLEDAKTHFFVLLFLSIRLNIFTLNERKKWKRKPKVNHWICVFLVCLDDYIAVGWLKTIGPNWILCEMRFKTRRTCARTRKILLRAQWLIRDGKRSKKVKCHVFISCIVSTITSRFKRIHIHNVCHKNRLVYSVARYSKWNIFVVAAPFVYSCSHFSLFKISLCFFFPCCWIYFAVKLRLQFSQSLI